LQRTIGNQAVQRLLGQAEPDDLEARSSTKEVTRFAHDFSQIPVHAKSPASVQAKLTVSSPGDIYEQEADRVSEQVMSMSAPQLQRTCACGGECPKCQTEQPGQEPERLQTKRVGSSDLGQTSVPSIVHEVLRSPGQSLDPAPRTFMESRFGHDFSRVRVHSDARAAESAQAVNALAYTAGRHLVFGAGQYSPMTASGRRLLAHELAHSVQQGFAVNPLPQLVGDPRNALERQADEAADGVIKNVSLPSVGNTISMGPTVQTILLQREEEEELIPELELPHEEEKITIRSSGTEHEMFCEKKYLVESWGQDTCCSRLGFIDNEAVNKKDGKTMSSCNKWPLFLALHAQEHGLEGVASCQPTWLGHTAQIKVGGKTLTVGCIDARANENKVIEIDAEAAQRFFGSKNLREHADEVCYGSSFATCKFETPCRPFPKETHCLPVGVTKPETDSPARHGWHKR
jgi:hypothetical protein